MARTYKPGRTSSGFRPIGQGLQASRRELQEQAQIRIDSLKLSKEQHKEASNIKIAGLSDNARFQEGVQKEKHVLANAVRTRQNEALSIKADRDVDRLKGEAEEAEKYAEFVAKYGPFAPKSIANYQKIGTGLIEGYQNIQSQKKIKESIERGDFAKPIKWSDDARTSLFKNVLKELDPNGKLSKEQRIALYGQTFGSKNSGYGLWAYDQIRDRSVAEQAAVKQIIQKIDGLGLTESNADEIYEFAAYERLRQLGINPTSKYGQKIIAQYQAWGRLEAINKGFQADATLTDEHLRTSIQEKVLPLKGVTGESERLQLNQNFNAGVSRTVDGTWKVNDQYVTGKSAGIGEAFEHYGTLTVQSNPERFGSKDEVRDFFDRQCILGQEGKKGCESWGKKHAGRVEEIVKAWETAQRDKGNDHELKQKAIGTELRLSITGQINARNAAVNKGEAKYTFDGQEYDTSVSLADYNLSLVKQIDSSDAPPEVKRALLTETGLLSSDAANHADKYLFIQTLILDQNDNIDDAAALRIATTRFLSLTKSERDALRPEFEQLQNVSGFTFTHNKQTYSSVNAIAVKAYVRVKAANKDKNSGVLGGGSQLSVSGNRASELYTQMVVETANSLIVQFPDKYGNNKNAAVEDAFGIVEEEFKKGAPTYTGEKENRIKVEGTGVFKRHSATIEGGVTGWVYDGLVNSSDEPNISLLAERLDASLDGTLAHAKDEIGMFQINEYTEGTVRDAIKFLGKTPEAMLTDPRLISPHNVTKLQRYLFKKAELIKDPYFSDEPLGNLEGMDQALKNINALSKASGEDVPTTINKLMAHYGHEERWPTDESTLSRLQNNGIIVKPGNRRGIRFWKAATNQNILPKTPQVEKALQGKSIQDIFKEDNGVDWIKGSASDTSAGSYTISDPKKFFDNGGINLLIRDGVPADVLQTLGFIDADVDVGDLQSSAELKDYLSPKEYRQILYEKQKNKGFFLDRKLPHQM